MRNEGPKLLMISLLALSVLGFLTCELPIVGGIVSIIILLGVAVYLLWREYKRWTFPVPFIEPNEDQRALISDYFEQVEEVGKKFKVRPMGVILCLVELFFLVIAYGVTKQGESEVIGLVFILSAISIGILITVYYIRDHRDTSRFRDYKIGKVEFYDSCYVHTWSPSTSMYTSFFGKSYETEVITAYYVFVRSYDGETMRLKVPYQVHCNVAANSTGVGYLIKYRHKFGLFDIYDFVPEDRSNGNIRRRKFY